MPQTERPMGPMGVPSSPQPSAASGPEAESGTATVPASEPAPGSALEATTAAAPPSDPDQPQASPPDAGTPNLPDGPEQPDQVQKNQVQASQVSAIAPAEGGEGHREEGREGLTVKEAARALGISPKAVQGRIERGTLEAWKTMTKYGEQWRVQLPENAAPPSVPAVAPGEASHGDTPMGPNTEGGQGTHMDTPMGPSSEPQSPAASSVSGTGQGTPMEPYGVPHAEPSEATDPDRPAPTWKAERLQLLARLEESREQVTWLRGQVEAHAAAEAEQRAHAMELARLLEGEQHNRAALEARIVRALPAPIVPMVEDMPREQAAQEAPAEPERGMDGSLSNPGSPWGGAEETEAPRRPWWRFWR